MVVSVSIDSSSTRSGGLLIRFTAQQMTACFSNLFPLRTLCVHQTTSAITAHLSIPYGPTLVNSATPSLRNASFVQKQQQKNTSSHPLFDHLPRAQQCHGQTTLAVPIFRAAFHTTDGATFSDQPTIVSTFSFISSR